MRIFCLLLGASLLACSDPPTRPDPYGCVTESWLGADTDCTFFRVPREGQAVCRTSLMYPVRGVERCSSSMTLLGCCKKPDVEWCQYVRPDQAGTRESEKASCEPEGIWTSGP